MSRSSDPRDPRHKSPELAGTYDSWSGTTWAWIGGIALAVIIVVPIFASSDGNRTAQQQAMPPATTGQPANPPARTAPRPPATDGQKTVPPANPAPSPAPAR